MGVRVVCGENERLERWLMQRLGTQWNLGRGECIGLERDGELTACVLYESYNGASISMHVAAEPGARWLNRHYLYICFAYPFLQLGVRKILGYVGSPNTQARRFDEHLGFRHEATLSDSYPGGDLLLYSMTKEQCRWLNLPLTQQATPNGQTRRTPAS